MNWKRIRLMLIICFGALAVSLACSPGIPFLSQAEPTATSRATGVARATFTAKPPPTEIIEPTDEPTETAAPEEPTETPVPVTVEPTAKPQVQNTAKPRPTNP